MQTIVPSGTSLAMQSNTKNQLNTWAYICKSGISSSEQSKYYFSQIAFIGHVIVSN